MRTEAAANGGTGYLMIAKGWDQNGRYINKNANAGAGNHTVIFLGSDRVNPRDSAWILEQSQFYKARVRSIAWSSLSDYRLVTSHRSYDSRFSVPGRNGF